MEAAGTRIAYWLIPGGEDFRRWRGVIEELAGRCGGPVFDPHVTIAVLPATEAAPPAGSGHALTLTATGLRFSDRYTLSCYVAFERSRKLEELAAGIGGDPARFVRVPVHMSLCYGALAERVRAAIRGRVRLPAAVTFGSLRRVMIPGEITGAADVMSWRTLDELPL